MPTQLVIATAHRVRGAAFRPLAATSSGEPGLPRRRQCTAAAFRSLAATSSGEPGLPRRRQCAAAAFRPLAAILSWGLVACGLAACDSPTVVSMPSPDAGVASETHDHASDGGARCDGRGWTELEPDQVLYREARDSGVGFELRLLEAQPSPPVVGNNSWLVELTHAGEPLTELEDSIEVTPFMPDHGHGTPTRVSVTETEPGVYRLEPVHLRMAGYWDITLDVEAPDAEGALSFGVCIE